MGMVTHEEYGIFGNVAVIRHQAGWLGWGSRGKDVVGGRLKKEA